MPDPEPFVQGIKDVEIRIYCNGGSTSVAQALTDSNGFFTVLGNTLDGITFEQTSLPCFAIAELPGDQSCSVFLPKSTLTSTISLVGTLSQHPTGPFANAAATHFVPAH
ncbi:uncharacterized protein [Coffea arabica]|uniref:Uncharacterized protein n=1 Tax=Coffea arabica TaxID=13443 RepID=A0ABM4W8A1_COFAR